MLCKGKVFPAWDERIWIKIAIKIRIKKEGGASEEACAGFIVREESDLS
jgi:hypothetical protein